MLSNKRNANDYYFLKFFKIYFVCICACTWTCDGMHICQDNLRELALSSFLSQPSCEFWRLNPGCQGWRWLFSPTNHPGSPRVLRLSRYALGGNDRLSDVITRTVGLFTLTSLGMNLRKQEDGKELFHWLKMCLVSTVHGEYQGWEGHHKGSDLSSRDSDSNSPYIFYIKEKVTFLYMMFAEVIWNIFS